jgi:hypothetical protein
MKVSQVGGCRSNISKYITTALSIIYDIGLRYKLYLGKSECSCAEADENTPVSPRIYSD